jgi:Zn-dependent M28 family amino/carboxypeptidase
MRLTLLGVTAALLVSAAALPGVLQRGTTPAPLPAVAIDAAQLLDDAKVLSADSMEGRKIGTPGAARARDYIVSRFKASGIEPFDGSYTREFAIGDEKAAAAARGVNVVGRLVGSGQPVRHIVVSAHYDHIGVVSGQINNGADDNASGTAALFALARYYAAHRPRHTLIFAAFDGEEANLSGARAFVRRPPVDVKTIALNLNADMIGRDANNRLFVSGTFTQPALKPFVERVARRAPVKVTMGYDDPSKGQDDWVPRSDQWPFIQAGIPGLYVGVEDYEHYHRPSDDYETLTHAFYVNAVETIRLLIDEFDRGL